MAKRVLKFYADWCQPCKMLARVVEDAKDKIDIPVEDVNIDENLFMTQQMGVRGVPTLVIVDDDDKEISRKIGYMSEAEFISFVKGE
jgi:thioredoxin 1